MNKTLTKENTINNIITEDSHNKKVSVVIPTLQKNITILDKLINSLDSDNSVSEIILIDNSTKGYSSNCKKLKVIIPKENIFVNPAWNLGVNEAKENIVALLNDDIIIPDNFCKNIISKITHDMGIIGYNSGDFVEPIEDINNKPNEQNLYLEKAKFMDLYFGIAMFFQKSSYYSIPEEIKITYGDAWLYYKNKRNKKHNYRISGQTIYHWGSLSSSSKKLSDICRNDAKLYKKLMIKWQDRLFSFDNIWDCFKIRIFGFTIKIKKLKKVNK